MLVAGTMTGLMGHVAVRGTGHVAVRGTGHVTVRGTGTSSSCATVNLSPAMLAKLISGAFTGLKSNLDGEDLI